MNRPLALFLLLLFSTFGFAQAPWPSNLRRHLTSAEAAELYSLAPSQAGGEEPGFHGYKVLGQTALTKERSRALASALVAAVEARQEPAASDCFAPRHGLRLGDVDLVVCFECHRLKAYRSGRFEAELLMTDDAAPIFRSTVEESGLAWDGWVKSADGCWRCTWGCLSPPPGFSESSFGRTLRLQRSAPRLEPLVLRPIGTAVLTSQDGSSREMAVGHQGLKGWSELVHPLETYFPGLEVSLDESAARLRLSGAEDVLGQAEVFLKASSSPPGPETLAIITYLGNSSSSALPRYRVSWEREYAVRLEPRTAPPLSPTVRELYSGTAVLNGVPTRFSIALLEDNDNLMIVQTAHPETDQEENVMLRILGGLHVR